MKIIRNLLIALACLIVLLVAVVFSVIAWNGIEVARQRRKDAPFAEEGHRSAERFLLTNSAKVMSTLSQTNYAGEFVRLEGGGFNYPFWNISGFNYLNLNRTAVFSKGSIRIRVFVTQGLHTAEGKLIGTPILTNGMFFVHVHDEGTP